MNCTTGAHAARLGPIECRACDLCSLCKLTGLIASDTGKPRLSPRNLRSLRAGGSLYSASQPAKALFAVREGMLKSVRWTANGEEHVLAFHVPGDVIGLEAFGSDTYACDVIAVTPAQCCEMPLPALRAGSPEAGALASELVHLLGRAIAEKTSLTRGCARERVAAFLQELSDRLHARGFDTKVLSLGMSRLEIANLLDTRIETISRTLQELHREGVIDVHRGEVRLIDLEAVSSTEHAEL